MHSLSGLDQFTNQKYLNLETFRRNGQGVPTPVWFVEQDGKLYVRTGANSGKAKRIRNNPQVRVAPCKVQGELLGEWVNATAHRLDEKTAQSINRLFARKYGLQKLFFDVLGRFQKFETATYEITLEDQKTPDQSEETDQGEKEL